MTLVPQPLQDKRCFVYCGPEQCNCSAGHSQRQLNNKTIQDQVAEQQSPDSDSDSTPAS